MDNPSEHKWLCNSGNRLYEEKAHEVENLSPRNHPHETFPKFGLLRPIAPTLFHVVVPVLLESFGDVPCSVFITEW